MKEKEEVVVLYSGGTDSTCTAALMAGKFNRIHLLTYQRFGIFSVTNSETNVKRLKEKFGEEKFIHRIIGIDRLFKEVAYANYLHLLKKYGFFVLSTCGQCKLAMHLRTLIYCFENNISRVCDGAHKEMSLFPAQMRSVLKEIEKMYARYGVTYLTPVFNLDSPPSVEIWDRFLAWKGKKEPSGKQDTAGQRLFAMGLMPRENVKGARMDHQMQARCFQLILFNIFLRWYYLPGHSYEEYERRAVEFYQEKITSLIKLVSRYLKEGERSRLFKLLKK